MRARPLPGSTSALGPGAEFDVEQADGIVLGHDRSVSLLTVVDPRTFQVVFNQRVDLGLPAGRPGEFHLPEMLGRQRRQRVADSVV